MSEDEKAVWRESRKSETGEEVMRPYTELSEKCKDLDRMTVRAVLAGIDAAGYAVVSQKGE